MSTLHNEAKKEDFAKTVLMPGDPMRAKFIAENYLEDAKCINKIRGMFAYTGKYKNNLVSVMGHGMGIPSIGIYTYELYNFYEVDNIIRIGSCGSLQDYINIYDIIFAVGAHTDSNYGYQYGLNGTFCPTATYELLEKAVNIARKNNIKYHIGNILTSDIFYSNDPKLYDNYKKYGTLAVDMETIALYMNATEAKKNALSILTVSDHIYKGIEISPKESEKSFTNMIEIALEIAINTSSMEI